MYVINNKEEYHFLLNNTVDDSVSLIVDLNKCKESLNFYKENINIIKKYIKINTVNIKNAIVLSLRLGMGENEISNPSPFESDLRLPFEYYKNAIQFFLNNNFIDTLMICSDNYSDDYLNHFKEYTNLNIVLCNELNTLEQFELIVNADYFISSNSTFSLIGATLNTNGIITMPQFKESNTIYPHESNKKYSELLNLDHVNVVKIDI
jgi:ADP-heptose:LPS heptosyltransferase